MTDKEQFWHSNQQLEGMPERLAAAPAGGPR